MKICYLCTDPGIALAKYNGSASHLRSIVRSFAELGHEVDLLIRRPEGAAELGVRVRPIQGSDLAGQLSEMLGTLGAAERRATRPVVRALRHVWNNTAVERALVEQLAGRWPDLIYERYSPFSVAGGVVARRRGIPHVLEVNAPLAWEGARHRGQALGEAAQALEQLAFEATSRIVAVSHELRDQLVEAGVASEKIHVVPNGVDAARFRPDGPSRREGRDRRIVVGFVGSLKVWHGLELLVEAFEAVADDPRIHLLVVGDGPLADLLRALDERWPGRVSLPGAVHPEQVPEYVRAFDVAVAPYPPLERFYFSPLKVLEYMAAGRAIVASRIGQLRGLIRHGETGLLVEPGDARALAGALRQLADDEALRRRLGHEASAEALREHSWKRRAAEILELVAVAA